MPAELAPPPAAETKPVESTPQANTPAPETSVLNDPELEAQFSNPFQSLDEKVKPKAKEEPAPEKKDEPKPEAEKAETKKDDKVATPPKEKPVPKQLKEHNDQLLNELKEERRVRQELERKYKEAEEKGKSTSKLAEQIAAKEKEIAEIRAELSTAKFSESDDFKKNYVTPLARKVESVKARIGQLKVITGMDENQQPVTRAASFDDIMSLYNMSEGDALEATQRLFGPVQSRAVDRYLSDLHELAERRDIALQEERGNWESRVRETETKKLREREAIEQMRSVIRKDIAEKNAQWFGEDPNDPDGNELLKEGYKMADEFFKRDDLPPQDRTIFEEHVRHRLAAFPRLLRTISAKDSRIAELEEKLAGKKASLPGAVRREGGETIKSEETDMLQDPELMEAFKG